MSEPDGVRGEVRRHFPDDTPMWRAKIYDGDHLASMHFVADWAEAIDLANDGVRQLRGVAPEVTGEEWPRVPGRYSRVGKMRHQLHRTRIAAMRSDGTFESTIMVSVLKAFCVLPEEIGLELRREDRPVDEAELFAAELAPALGNPLVQAALADPDLKRMPPDLRCRVLPWPTSRDGSGIAIHDSRMENEGA